MSTQWYVKVDGQERGPLEAGAVLAMLAKHEIEPTAQVREGEAGPWSSVLDALEDLKDDAGMAAGADAGVSDSPLLTDEERDMDVSMPARQRTVAGEPSMIQKVAVVGGVLIVLGVVLALMVHSILSPGITETNALPDIDYSKTLRPKPPGGWAVDVELDTQDLGDALPGPAKMYLVPVAGNSDLPKRLRQFTQDMIQAAQTAEERRERRAEYRAELESIEREINRHLSRLAALRRELSQTVNADQRAQLQDEIDAAQTDLEAAQTSVDPIKKRLERLGPDESIEEMRQRRARAFIDELESKAVRSTSLVGNEDLVTLNQLDVAQVMVVIMPDHGRWLISRYVNVAARPTLTLAPRDVLSSVPEAG